MSCMETSACPKHHETIRTVSVRHSGLPGEPPKPQKHADQKGMENHDHEEATCGAS